MMRDANHNTANEELRDIAVGFNDVASIRERAEALRHESQSRLNEYHPIEAATIPGGHSMLRGFLGVMLREAATEVYADRLDHRADKLTQQLIGKDIVG